MAIDLYNILDYVAPAPTYTGKLEEAGLITKDDLQKARNQSMIQGLLSAGLTYLAQPKNQGYGSSIPYLSQAALSGLGAMQKPMQQLGEGAIMNQKMNQIVQEAKDKTLTQKYIEEMVNSEDKRWQGLDKAPTDIQNQAVKEYLSERFKAPTAAKAPTQRTREILKDGELYKLDEEWVDGKWKQVGDPTPKEVSADTAFDKDSVEMFARSYIVDAKLPTFGRGKTGEENRKKVFDRVAEIVKDSGMTFDEFKFNQIANAAEIRDQTLSLNRFSTGPQGNTVRSLNVAMHHLHTLDELSDALNNKDIQAINTIKNYASKQFGDADVTNFEFSKQIVADEINKAVIGSGAGTGEERKELANNLSTAKSWSQLKGVIKTAKKLMAGQLTGLKSQYESSVGPKLSERKPFESRLDPVTQELFKEYSGGPTQTKNQISKEDQDALNWYKNAPDSMTKTEIGKKLKAKGLI